MMFFGKRKDADPNQPKRRSTWGLLFNPQIGEAVRPLGETTSVFVQLIAMVFAMNGLFPKDHPGLTGAPGSKLTLSEILSTAWNGLSFTKVGLPKVILFFAVVGMMILAVLSVITALLTAFTGTAHAQNVAAPTATGFFSPAGTNDLAQGWIDYIFKGLPLADYYSQTGQQIPQTINIQCAMMSALGFYSNGMLIFAAIILFYHLISMVVNTAHEGVAMGKRTSQVWAPIRLVVAVGLLVPVGSPASACHTTGGGLNTGQYIVIQLASWGSGLASQTWSTFINTLASMKYNYIQPNAPLVDDVVKNISEMEACRYSWNYHMCEMDAAAAGADPGTACADPNNYTMQNPGFKDQQIPAPTPTVTPSGEAIYSYTPNNVANGYGICGLFIIKGTTTTATATTPQSVGTTLASTIQGGPDQIAQALAKAQQDTFQALLPQFEMAGMYVRNLIPTLNDGPIPANTVFISLANNYQTQLKQNLDSALQQDLQPLLDSSIITSLGWAAGGAWLNTIARDQGSIVSAYQDGLPITTAPNMQKLTGKEKEIGTQVSQELGSFKTFIEATPTSPNPACAEQGAAAAGGSFTTGGTTVPTNLYDPSSGVALNTDPTQDDPAQRVSRQNLQNALTAKGGIKDQIKFLVTTLSGRDMDGKSLLEKIFAIVDNQAADSGIWQNKIVTCSPNGPGNSFTLGAQLVSANPLAELSFWGYANLRVAYNLLQAIIDFSVLEAEMGIESQIKIFTAGRDPGQQVQAQTVGLEARLYGFVAGLFGMMSTIFFMCGFTLAFVVPLLPFFRFFFNVLTWIVSLLEAVVAVPLIALAHLNPEGEGLPGQSAKAAYFMVFNIFLRPVMTIFGLIAGLIVFYVAIMLLNVTYAIAVAGTDAGYHFGIETVVRVAYTIMYGAIAYVCANNCFKPIGMFPEYAIRWIGAQAHHERMGDGGRAVQGVMGQAQGFMGEKAIGLVRLKPPS